MDRLEPLVPVLRRMFSRDSEFFVVQGPRGVGKTNFILLLMEASHEYGYFRHYCGNVELEGPPFDYQLIRDLQTLKMYAKSLGRKVFFFFDEMGKNIPRGTPWMRLNLETLKSLEVIRKYKLTLGGAFIGQESVSQKVLSPDYLDAYVVKLNLTKAILHDLRLRQQVRLMNIPPTRVRYAEYQDVSFYERPCDDSQRIRLFTPEEITLIEKRKAKEPMSDAEKKRFQRLRDAIFWKVYKGAIELDGDREGSEGGAGGGRPSTSSSL